VTLFSSCQRGKRSCNNMLVHQLYI
jgi:hypothetical protein